ncbi:MAG: hypothetical protein AAF430_13705 [Myxococcota bacterium]
MEFLSRVAERVGALSDRERRIVLLGVVAVATTLGYALLVRGPLARLQALARQDPSVSVESIRAEVSRLDATIVDTEAHVVAARDRLFGGLAELPAEKTESYIIERLDAISGRYAVDLVGVNPGPSRSVMSFDEHIYEVEATGEFFALFAWLNELEVELRPLVVNEFGLVPRGEAGGVRLSVRLASYRPTERAS